MALQRISYWMLLCFASALLLTFIFSVFLGDLGVGFLRKVADAVHYWATNTILLIAVDS